jgi:hypothetical protein
VLSAAWAALLLLSATPRFSHAQRVSVDSLRVNDSTIVYRVMLSDGSKLVGHVTMLSADSVRIRSAASTTTVARSAIREARAYPLSAMRNGELWPENPHATRLLFSPTAIPLRKGESYFADFWVFIISAAHGVTDRFTLGGGMTVLPGLSLEKNVLYAMPKYTVIDRPAAKLALGGLLATVPIDSDRRKSLGLLYAVGTVGSRENNLTVGTGFGYVGNTLSKTPVVTVGGQTRVARHLALITENWFVPSEGADAGFVTYGVRFLDDKFAVDLAFGTPIDGGGVSFPGVPLLGFAVKF